MQKYLALCCYLSCNKIAPHNHRTGQTFLFCLHLCYSTLPPPIPTSIVRNILLLKYSDTWVSFGTFFFCLHSLFKQLSSRTSHMFVHTQLGICIPPCTPPRLACVFACHIQVTRLMNYHLRIQVTFTPLTLFKILILQVVKQLYIAEQKSLYIFISMYL